MGLIKAAAGAVGGVFADQWRDYFCCNSLDADTLATKGEKKAGGRSSNTKGEDNIISNGSIVAVNEGQCMMIVDQGKIVEICAEPGEFVYDTSTEPSIFYGELGDNIKNTFKEIGKRFTFGGDAARDQRVYFFNTKEIMGNKYGTASPIAFRIVDKNLGLDMDSKVRCHGEYSYKITNPMLFYTNVCGNVTSDYMRSEIDGQLKSELLTALQSALSELSAIGIRYSEVPAHAEEICDSLNEKLTKKWKETRGIEIISFAVSAINIPEEDEAQLKEIQRNAVFRNPGMAAAHTIGTRGQAVQDAAKNEGGMGAMGGFFGMNMAQNNGNGNVDVNSLFAMDQAMQAQANKQQPQQSSGWTCTCGKSGNTGKFCSECGLPMPQNNNWTCSCGTQNTGKFCQNCGQPKPSNATYKCNKCGWVPDDPANPPKFCPECGDPFDNNDLA